MRMVENMRKLYYHLTQPMIAVVSTREACCLFAQLVFIRDQKRMSRCHCE